jgi:hypothetical protein
MNYSKSYHQYDWYMRQNTEEENFYKEKKRLKKAKKLIRCVREYSIWWVSLDIDQQNDVAYLYKGGDVRMFLREMVERFVPEKSKYRMNKINDILND